MVWTRFVPLIDGFGKVVGVITDRDICIATATRHRPPESISAAETIAGPVRTCLPEDSVIDALYGSQAAKRRRIASLRKRTAQVTANTVTSAGRPLTPALARPGWHVQESDRQRRRPILLLHGPGDFAGMWSRVIPNLVTTHRIVAPDLPGHGTSQLGDGRLDADGLRAWLSGVIERTCPSPPVLVGHVLGGAIGARFAVNHSDRLSRLVLVDSLGLARFRPTPTFALTMLAFLARPTERTYTRFMRQCSYDLDGLREEMGARWEPFLAYSLERARGPGAKLAGRLLREFGTPRIPPDDLARITAPTVLIWGRHDRANRLRIAEQTSARYGWPLHVIENCADDPPRDQPRPFLEALRAALGVPTKQEPPLSRRPS